MGQAVQFVAEPEHVAQFALQPWQMFAPAKVVAGQLMTHWLLKRFSDPEQVVQVVIVPEQVVQEESHAVQTPDCAK